ncbi:hypothetical protein DLK05_05875 [Ancylomarina longa]|uniref:Uncharacterized protein n=1 Tax=Ancylomarina longa TaxID=2487017 RepID=A0A434AX77_9BACT|nr:hypothetical protein DLK05_05875 [Ancylomarina longa]
MRKLNAMRIYIFIAFVMNKLQILMNGFFRFHPIKKAPNLKNLGAFFMSMNLMGFELLGFVIH